MKSSLLEHIPTLHDLRTITLAEMKEIKLMNRVDTKYLTNVNFLHQLLEKAKLHYRVQVVNTVPVSMYQTLYYDTPDAEMYKIHHNQQLHRQKIRTRTYLDSQLSFLEVKNKTNKGRTDKKRVMITGDDFYNFRNDPEAVNFFKTQSAYHPENLVQQVKNTFERITLVDDAKTERITIDCNICFQNLYTGHESTVPDIMIIELKQDGYCHSTFKNYLNEFRIKPVSISKYCLGTILTNDSVKTNRFKKKLVHINKVCM